MFFGHLLTEQLGEMTGNRLRERGGGDAQHRAPGQVLNSGAAAARTKPLYMGCPLYPLS